MFLGKLKASIYHTYYLRCRKHGGGVRGRYPELVRIFMAAWPKLPLLQLTSTPPCICSPGVFPFTTLAISWLAHFYGEWYTHTELLDVPALFQKCAGLRHLHFSSNTWKQIMCWNLSDLLPVEFPLSVHISKPYVTWHNYLKRLGIQKNSVLN